MSPLASCWLLLRLLLATAVFPCGEPLGRAGVTAQPTLARSPLAPASSSLRASPPVTAQPAERTAWRAPAGTALRHASWTRDPGVVAGGARLTLATIAHRQLTVLAAETHRRSAHGQVRPYDPTAPPGDC